MRNIKNITLIFCLCLTVLMVSCGTSVRNTGKAGSFYGSESEYDKKSVWVIGNDIIQKLNSGEFADIEKYMDHLVVQKPFSVNGTRVLEELYRFVGKRIYSSDMLDKWCSKEPAHHSAFILRGNYYIEQAWKHRGTGYANTVTEDGWIKFKENLELAKKDLEKAYAMNPEDPNSAASMLTVCKGGLGHGEEEMESWFKKAIEADPVAYKAYHVKQDYLRPKWHGTKEKDRAFAEYCYKNAPPKSIIHEIMLDYIIENIGWSENKQRYHSDPSILKIIDDVVQKTLKNFPDSVSIRIKLAKIEVSKRNIEKAISIYSEILESDPGNPEVLRERGGLYDRIQRDSKLAQADILNNVESDPYGPNNFEALAKIANVRGNYKKAIEYYTRAIERNPKTLKLYVERGFIKMNSLQDNASALEDFKEAEKLNTRFIATKVNIAYCLEKMGRIEEAKAYCIQALKLVEIQKSGANDRKIPPAVAENHKRSLNEMLSRLNASPNQFPVAKRKFRPNTPNKHSTVNWGPISQNYTVFEKILSQYPGTYKINRDTNVMIRVLNHRLISQLTGEGVVALFAETEDKFLNRKLNTEVAFFKDESRNITHLMLTHDGVEKKAVRISDEVTDTNAVTLTTDTLSQYAGIYRIPSFRDIKIIMESNQLFAQFGNLMKKALFPESETVFFDNVIDTRLEFIKDESGKVSHIVFTQGNAAITAKRKQGKKVSIPENYGLSEQTAIKTGGGPRGERVYLDKLCGPNSEKINYRRLGSCCAFESPNAPFNNTGLLDIYEVTYEGLSEPVNIYLNMYDPPTERFYPPPGFKMKDH